MDWTWFITTAAITGTVANIFKIRWCFVIWFATNTLWMIVDYRAVLHSQAFQFSIYAVLAIWGFIKWKKG